MSVRTSFLLPVRDGAATIGAALDSVLAQTDTDFEVVVVDDGSTDSTAAIVERFPVRLVRTPPRGLVAALNTGLAVCEGRFVARMDADDVAAPERLALQIPILEGEPDVAVVDGQVRFFRDEGPVEGGMRAYEAWIGGVLTPEDFDRELLVESPVVHPAATFRKDVVVGLGGYRDGPFPEDYDLWLRLHAAGHRFRKVPEVLVHMRDHPRRLTRTHPRYGEAAFDHARRSWLAPRLPERVVLWGAGRAGRPWLPWLQERCTVPAVIDVDPRKIGRTRHGVPVVDPEALPSLDVALCLVAVGARGARALIREDIARLRPDWREGRDWFAVR